LGARIETLRTLAELSARELDALADLTAGHTRFLELGRTDRVEVRTLAKIADVFGVTLDWLYTGDGSCPRNESIRDTVARHRRRAQRAKTGTSG
jgi:transcriptional regulator with XRE-family HTH domain